MTETSSKPAGSYSIRSEARGPHWVAWVARPDDGKPVRSIIQVGRTREEAEARAKAWAAQLEAEQLEAEQLSAGN